MHRHIHTEPRAKRSRLTQAHVRERLAGLLKVDPEPGAAASIGLFALVASFAAGCQSRPVTGIAFCVLKETSVDQGCATSPDGSPLIDLGATAFNKQSSKVIAIDTTGEGGDSVTVTSVAFNGLASDKFQLALYTLGFTGEQPASLPFTLYPPSSGKVCELRVRVTFTASQPGPIPWEELQIQTADSTDSIPIVGSALERVIGTPFTACVLKGIEVSQGCELDAAGKPVVDLGSTRFGKQSSKVIAFTSTGQDGEPITLTELKLEGQSSLDLQLAAFTLTTAGEVPVQLPLTLYPPGSGKVSEIRARVTLTASTPGTLQLQGVKAATADYAVAVPVVGAALERVIGTPFTTCVLKGIEVSQSCEVDAAGKPVVNLGTIGFGKQASKVIAFTSTGQDGEPITLTELKLAGQSSLNLQLAAFTLTTAGEVPVQLPLTLYPPGSGMVSEIRARVTLTASTPGAVQLQEVKVATADYAVAVPVAGTALDRLKVPIATSVACGASYSCKTETLDVCAHLPDLASGEVFTVRFDNVGSSWSNSHEMLVHFTKGTAYTFAESTSGKKINITKLDYDGACGVYASSQYSGSDTEFFQAQARISDLSYGAL